MIHREGLASAPGFPPRPGWFRDTRGVPRLGRGLCEVDLGDDGVAALRGGSRFRHFVRNFGPGDEVPDAG